MILVIIKNLLWVIPRGDLGETMNHVWIRPISAFSEGMPQGLFISKEPRGTQYRIRTTWF